MSVHQTWLGRFISRSRNSETPNAIGSSEQVERVFLVCLVWNGGARLLINRCKPHQFHQIAHLSTADLVPLTQQNLLHPPRPITRGLQILLVYQGHQFQVFLAHRTRPVIIGRTVEFKQLALPDKADFGMFGRGSCSFAFLRHTPPPAFQSEGRPWPNV